MNNTILEAFQSGYDAGREYQKNIQIKDDIDRLEKLADELFYAELKNEKMY